MSLAQCDCYISYDVVSTEPVRSAARSDDLLSHWCDRIDSEFAEAWHSIRIESTGGIIDSHRIYRGSVRFVSNLQGAYSIRFESAEDPLDSNRIDWGPIRIECQEVAFDSTYSVDVHPCCLHGRPGAHLDWAPRTPPSLQQNMIGKQPKSPIIH
jgi:hypothetical protein